MKNKHKPFKLGVQEIGFENKLTSNLSLIKSNLAENLRVLRKELFKGSEISKDLQQSHLAIACGISKGSIKNIEAQLGNPSSETILRLASIGNVPPHLMLEKDGVSRFFSHDTITKEVNAAPVRIKVRSIGQRIKAISFFVGDEGACMMLPNGAISAKPVNSSVELFINDQHKFYIDILKSKETGEIFFMHSDTCKDIIKASVLPVISKLPTELCINKNVGVTVIISMYRDHIVKVRYHDEPRVLKNYAVHTGIGIAAG